MSPLEGVFVLHSELRTQLDIVADCIDVMGSHDEMQPNNALVRTEGEGEDCIRRVGESKKSRDT
jgi:hypothetical protein